MALPTPYQQFIHLSRYARWVEAEQRRETWLETVQRYSGSVLKDLPVGVRANLEQAIYNLEIMPSMRAMWAAGPALERCNVTGYNCSYLHVDSPRAFDEALYISMCGAGVGFSVERQFIKELPQVPEALYPTDTTIIVYDSRVGWAKAYRELSSLLYAGHIPQWDMSQVRAAGSVLKTSGGRASGPGPLEDLFKFTVQIFKGAVGRKLNSVECHDLMTKVAMVVVVGGVRRSAMISLSNPSDDRMRNAKSGQWWTEHPQRALANNSAAYTERPDFNVFMREWLSLYESKSGERGIFNRAAAKRKAAKIEREVAEFGVNPCAEISLRSSQFCNLSEVVIRPEDDFESLAKKVELATILGTVQSSLTKFKYLRPRWARNCKEERLLGVSLTGICDHPDFGNPAWELLPHYLRELRDVAWRTNREWSEKLGIEPSKAITCVKPSGTVSQLVDSASGIHPRFSYHFIRRVRETANSPVAKLLIEAGMSYEEDVAVPGTLVFEFPMQAPASARVQDAVSALDLSDLWAVYAKHWADHSVSATVQYSDNEYMGLGQWVWSNFEDVTGLSFLPRSEHTYQQAPYEACDEATYEKLFFKMPDIDWAKLGEYEKEDHTEGAQTLACAGGSCEI